jgi:hypothetical protein
MPQKLVTRIGKPNATLLDFYTQKKYIGISHLMVYDRHECVVNDKFVILIALLKQTKEKIHSFGCFMEMQALYGINF